MFLRPANDNEICPYWQNLWDTHEEYKRRFKESLFCEKSLLRRRHDFSEGAKRSNDNFTWYVNFEICMREAEVNERRINIKVVY